MLEIKIENVFTSHKVSLSFGVTTYKNIDKFLCLGKKGKSIKMWDSADQGI